MLEIEIILKSRGNFFNKRATHSGAKLRAKTGFYRVSYLFERKKYWKIEEEKKDKISQVVIEKNMFYFHFIIFLNLKPVQLTLLMQVYA